MNEITAEIFAVGKWNGIKVTSDMLTQLANNFSRLSDNLDVPLKFGHNDEQDMTDGQPALGWVSKVWVEGEKLFAKFTDIPDVVYNLIEKKRYKNVSIEALFDVEHKGVKYGTVLTAVALLGADRPAVNTLSDLQTYMTANSLAFTSRATFSKKPINFNSEESPMTPEEQAEFDRLKAENLKLSSTVDSQTEKFNAQQKQLDELNKDVKEKAFAAEKSSVEADLEALVKDDKITPAQRDTMLKEFTAESKDKILFSIDLLKGNPATQQKDEQGRNGQSSDTGQPVSVRADIETRKFMANNSGHDYLSAMKQVFAIDTALAREFADENDEE